MLVGWTTLFDVVVSLSFSSPLRVSDQDKGVGDPVGTRVIGANLERGRADCTTVPQRNRPIKPVQFQTVLSYALLPKPTASKHGLFLAM